MRPWIPVLVIALAGCAQQGCLDFGGPWNFTSDPCPGHASSGDLFVVSDCDCPLESEIGPALEGKSCLPEGQICYSSGWFSNSCRCELRHWRCGAEDMSVARDFSVPEDMTPMDLLDSDAGD